MFDSERLVKTTEEFGEHHYSTKGEMFGKWFEEHCNTIWCDVML